MISWACTLGELRDQISSYIEAWGEKVPVGCFKETPDGSGFLDLVQIEWVYTDKDGTIVGDEADDYVPKDGEQKAIKIS